MSSQKKLLMKMCRKGHTTQKKSIKIWLKEIIFTVLCSKARIFRRRASVCLPLLETLHITTDITAHATKEFNSFFSF